MLRPLLIIGVGGSGGKTIRAMKQALNLKLLQNGYTDGLPGAWQFLQIDTVYDGLDFNAPMLSQEEVRIVVPSGATFGTILSDLEGRAASESDKNDLFAGWAIPRSDMDVRKGAGMIRGIGRQVGVADALGIRDALKTSVGKMLGPSTNTELKNIARALRVPDPNAAVHDDPSVILITSLSGGSGAGMFMDVAEILKRTYSSEAWAQTIVSFLYTAEVFQGISGAGDVRQNCLGALNEIVAGRYRVPSTRTNMLMDRLQITDPSPTIHYTGAQGNLLIGSRNSLGVDISKDASGVGMNEVFLTVGETLAGIVSNPRIAEWLYNQAFVNATTSTKIKDESGLSSNDPATVQTFASLGFGRVSLGVDRIIKYVADALTRSQIQALLFPDNLPASVLQQQTKEQIFDDKLEFAWENFLKNSGVNERESANDLTDALVPKNLSKLISDFTASVLMPIVNETKGAAVGSIATRTWNELETALETFKASVRNERLSQANDWAKNIQVTLIDQVAENIANFGLKMGSALVRKLIEEIDYVRRTDLLKEVADAERLVSKVKPAWWGQQVTEAAGGKAGLSKADRAVFENLTDLLTKVSKKIEELDRKNLAIELLTDFSENFLVPLEKSVTGEYLLLRNRFASRNPEDNGGIDLQKFPNIGVDTSVPQSYLPRSIERILIEPSEFLPFYLDYVTAEMDNKNEDPYQRAVKDSLLRRSVKNEAKKRQGLLRAKNWEPRQLSGSGSKEVTFEITTEFRSLLESNQFWVTMPESEFSRVASMSIREYCRANGDKVEQQKREKAFEAAFTEMMNLSAPLVTFNEAAMKTLKNPSGDAPTKMQRKAEHIPFEPGSSLGQALKSFLGGRLGIDVADSSFESQWFDANSNVQELFAIQVPEGPMPAYAFASMTSPIAESVRGAKNAAKVWSEYWINRRSRPLVEAVPVPDDLLRSIITGYYVAQIFDLVDEEKDPGWNKLRIWNPTLARGEYSYFPAPLLEASISDVEKGYKLPSVLTSIGLAMVNYGESGDVSHLYAHRFLKFLGREVTASPRIKRDTWDNNGNGDLLPGGSAPTRCDLLTRWVLEGTPDVLAGHAAPIQAGPAGPGPIDERKQHILNFLNEQKSLLVQSFAAESTNKWSLISNLWEIKDEVVDALNDIIAFVESITQAPQAQARG